MLPIANAARFGQTKYTFVDPAAVRSSIRVSSKRLHGDGNPALLRRRLLERAGEGNQLGTERLFHLLRISCSQCVLATHRTVRPKGCIIARTQIANLCE